MLLPRLPTNLFQSPPLPPRSALTPITMVTTPKKQEAEDVKAASWRRHSTQAEEDISTCFGLPHKEMNPSIRSRVEFLEKVHKTNRW